jgi:hypothetical protein
MSKDNAMWVVYQRVVHGNAEATNVVCEQGEWDALEQAKPGQHTLIQAGITNEGQAERLARGTSGDARKGAYPRRS